MKVRAALTIRLQGEEVRLFRQVLTQAAQGWAVPIPHQEHINRSGDLHSGQELAYRNFLAALAANTARGAWPQP